MGAVFSVSFAILAGSFAALMLRFLHRWKKSPNRPILTSFLDTICEPFALVGVGPWASTPDVHTAMILAMKSTNLTDWGGNRSHDFVGRYDIVRRLGLERSGAKFSPIGAYYLIQSLERRMKARLLMIDFLKKHPEIEDIKINPPVFVVGFTRTGTTFLHEMLGLHDGVRMHYTWEHMDPVPATNACDLPSLQRERKERYNRNKGFFNFMFGNIVSQRIQSIHRIGYDEPEECTLPCSLELPWALTELPFNTFAIDEVAEIGGGEAFVYYRKFLQMMAWQAEDRRGQDFTWMLKCPFHLPYLEDLHKEFPGATVIWTHRHPSECVASACSLYETLMCMAMDEATIDKAKLGTAVLHYTKRCLEMAEATIEKLGNRFHIVHVRYHDTVNAPKEQCRRVYEAVSRELKHISHCVKTISSVLKLFYFLISASVRRSYRSPLTTKRRSTNT